jgi:hypothetical protein
MGNDFQGNGYDINEASFQPLLGGQKTTKNVRIAGVLAEVRTEYRQNTSLERYLYVSNNYSSAGST